MEAEIEGEESGPKGIGFWRAWILATRPKTLTAAITPVMVGSGVAIAADGFRLGAALAALFGAVMIQVGTNLANDVFDFERGVDSAFRLGPTRVTQAGLLQPGQVRRGLALAYGLAGLAGVYLTWLAGWPVVVIGLVSLLAGLAYSTGPLPLSSAGLGDLFVMVFFGFVAVPATVYVQVGSVPQAAWPAALSIGSLATVVLGVNNLRDVETDRRAGRRSLPVVLGRQAGVIELVVLLGLAFFAPLQMVWVGLASPWALLTYLSLPRALRLARTVAVSEDGPTLNRALADSAKLLLLCGLLLALGIILGTSVE